MRRSGRAVRPGPTVAPTLQEVGATVVFPALGPTAMTSVHRWLLGAVLVLGLSACSSSRSSSPDGRVIRTPNGNVIVTPDGRVYEDRNRDGIPDRAENGRERRADRVTLCHKDKNTITVSESAVRAHLRHGDRIGTCRANDRRDDRRDGTIATATMTTTGGTTTARIAGAATARRADPHCAAANPLSGLST